MVPTLECIETQPSRRVSTAVRRRPPHRSAEHRFEGLETPRIATRVEEVLWAWRLVYQRYATKGLICPHPYRLHTVPQAVRPGTTVVIQRGLRIKTTMSCYLDGPEGLPLDTVYPRELNRARAGGRQLAESGLFAIRRPAGRRSVNDLIEFMGYAIHALYQQRVDSIAIGVHPRHVAFYTRLLGFEVAGPMRNYGLVRGHPVVLLRFDLSQLDERGPAARGVRFWRQHRLDASVFEERFSFPPHKLGQTVLPEYLRWQEKRDTEKSWVKQLFRRCLAAGPGHSGRSDHTTGGICGIWPPAASPLISMAR